MVTAALVAMAIALGLPRGGRPLRPGGDEDVRITRSPGFDSSASPAGWNETGDAGSAWVEIRRGNGLDDEVDSIAAEARLTGATSAEARALLRRVRDSSDAGRAVNR